MFAEKEISELKNIYEKLLNFLKNSNDTENTQNLINSVIDDSHKLFLFLNLLSSIANSYRNMPIFYAKMTQLFQILHEKISNYFTNSELFNIFRKNKRFVLFLIEEKLMNIDEYIIRKITTNNYYIRDKYPQYFAPEVKPYMTKNWFPRKSSNNSTNNDWIDDLNQELPKNFYENRRAGQNDSYICQLIQRDSVNEFIQYSDEYVSLVDSIKPSIYETNILLLRRIDVKLIEYSIFFGSLNIFNYLVNEGVELQSSMWPYVIYGNNAEMIQIFKDQFINDISYNNCLLESIECHRNDLVSYFTSQIEDDKNKQSQNNNAVSTAGARSANSQGSSFSSTKSAFGAKPSLNQRSYYNYGAKPSYNSFINQDRPFQKCLESYNFACLQNDRINNSCSSIFEYGYYSIAQLIIDSNIDKYMNSKIFKYINLMKFKK